MRRFLAALFFLCLFCSFSGCVESGGGQSGPSPTLTPEEQQSKLDEYKRQLEKPPTGG